MRQPRNVNAQQVCSYLQQNPEFFNAYPELLETLTLTQPNSANVVSLVVRQRDIFKNKQHKLETQLSSLFEIAKHNDLCVSRMHQLTLDLLNSASLETAINNLKQALTLDFLADFVALKIMQHNSNPALDDYFIAPDHENWACLAAELIHKKPRCGRLNVKQTRFLFADSSPQVKSCAVIPILRSDLTALLVIASCDENRFHYSLGHLFLNQLCEIVGTRLATLLKP